MENEYRESVFLAAQRTGMRKGAATAPLCFVSCLSGAKIHLHSINVQPLFDIATAIHHADDIYHLSLLVGCI